MKTNILVAAALLACTILTASAQPVPNGNAKITGTTAEKDSVDLIQGSDKKMHLYIDGVRVGHVLLDRTWKDKSSALTVIPPDNFEPPPKKPPPKLWPHPYPKPCGGPNVKCAPDVDKFKPLIKLPKDLEKLTVYVNK